MSILLDALRKSERRERLGDVPDIHNDTGAAAASPRPAWRTPALLAALVLVLALAVWAGWRAWSDPPVPVAPPEFPPEPVSPAAGTGEGDGQPAGPDAGATAVAPAEDGRARSPVEVLSGERPHREADSTSTTAATAPPADDRSSPDAAPTEERSVAARRAEKAGDGLTDFQRRMLEQMTRAVEETGMEEAMEAPAAASTSASARRDPAASESRSSPRSASSSRPAADSPPRPVPSAADEPGLISYWQLPENVRAGLPELRITVLAWDEQPEARFLILGGKRYGEGARVARNLTLEEIRRDRVLFRHGAYLFYVKQ